jgi:hypothetical protein
MRRVFVRVKSHCGSGRFARRVSGAPVEAEGSVDGFASRIANKQLWVERCSWWECEGGVGSRECQHGSTEGRGGGSCVIALFQFGVRVVTLVQIRIWDFEAKRAEHLIA